MKDSQKILLFGGIILLIILLLFVFKKENLENTPSGEVIDSYVMNMLSLDAENSNSYPISSIPMPDVSLPTNTISDITFSGDDKSSPTFDLLGPTGVPPVGMEGMGGININDSSPTGKSVDPFPTEGIKPINMNDPAPENSNLVNPIFSSDNVIM